MSAPWEHPPEPSQPARLKPKKVWQVGDKIFSDYSDAMRATTVTRRSIERSDFIQAVSDALNAASHRDARNDAEQISDALLAQFTVKRIKK